MRTESLGIYLSRRLARSRDRWLRRRRSSNFLKLQDLLLLALGRDPFAMRSRTDRFPGSDFSALALALAALAAAGCSSTPENPPVPPLLAAGLETLSEGELESRQLEPLARILIHLDRPLAPEEKVLARAVGRGMLDRMAKKREWGTKPVELAADLEAAARLCALAPERFDADDLACFVEEVDQIQAPRDVRAFLDAWTTYHLPRGAAASAAIIRGVSGSRPLEGLLEDLFHRGFRIDDATLRSYAEVIVADRFAVTDLLFVIKRADAAGSDIVAAKLPAFAERLMAWVHARPPAAPEPEARRRIWHNAAVALVQARERGVPLPEPIFRRFVLPGAGRADLALDDLAAAYAAYERPSARLLDERLAALRGARATAENLVELIQVAALMRESDHPAADEAQELVQFTLERPPGIDERLGARRIGRPYSPAAVRRLAEGLAGPLRASHRHALYFDFLAGFLHEQGEREIAMRFVVRNVARK